MRLFARFNNDKKERKRKKKVTSWWNSDSISYCGLLVMVYKIKKMPVLKHIFIVAQGLSHVQLFVTAWTAAPQAPLSSNVS